MNIPYAYGTIYFFHDIIHLLSMESMVLFKINFYPWSTAVLGQVLVLDAGVTTVSC